MRLHYTKALSLVDSKFTEQQKEGAFSGYAAATGNVDLGSDIILKGAFSDWLKTVQFTKRGCRDSLCKLHCFYNIEPYQRWSDRGQI